MIILHVHFKVAPEQRDVFLEKAKRVTAGTVAEEGTIMYHFYEDTVQPNSFILVEKWRDAESLDKHAQTAHFQEFVNGIEELLTAPLNVEKFEVQPFPQPI